MEYLRRTVDTQLDDHMQWEAAIAIDGPKGVGKTVTAQRRADLMWSSTIRRSVGHWPQI